MAFLIDDPAFWTVFLGAALVLNLSPGPDLVYVLSRSVAHGVRIGLASAAGVCCGALLHVIAAAWGLSAILATSATVFTAVKYAGAAYLVYLGIKALRAPGGSLLPPGAASSASSRPGAWQAFRQGVAIDVLNPKVALFFMAFLPQFVRDGHGPVAWQLLLLGGVVVAVAIVVEGLLVLAAARGSRVLLRRPRIAAWLDRVFGGVLLVLGLRLAMSEHRA